MSFSYYKTDHSSKTNGVTLTTYEWIRYMDWLPLRFFLLKKPYDI